MRLREAGHRAGCMHAPDTDHQGAFFRRGESNVLSADRPIAIELDDENAILHSGPNRQSLF
jgi:hypothetical protein